MKKLIFFAQNFDVAYVRQKLAIITNALPVDDDIQSRFQLLFPVSAMICSEIPEPAV